MKITVEHTPDSARLDQLNATAWPIWEKEVLEFPWHYDERETCYLLEGDVTVAPDDGEPVRFGKGDLVYVSSGHVVRLESPQGRAEALQVRLISPHQ